jgi:hypothetical protein
MTSLDAKTRCTADTVRGCLDWLDGVAADYERRWGAGVLPMLAGKLWAAKLEEQQQKVDAAVAQKALGAVRKQVEAMARGWKRVEDEALSTGVSEPSGGMWYVQRSDGVVVAVAHDWRPVSQLKVPFFTVQELVEVVPAIVLKAKQLFPGSAVKKAKEDDLDDQIPF